MNAFRLILVLLPVALASGVSGCKRTTSSRTDNIDAFSAREQALAILRHGPDDESRWRAIRILGALKATDAISDLETCLSHKDPNMRANAARALGDIGATASNDALLRVLRDDPDFGVIQQTSLALLLLKNKKSIGILKKRLGDVSDDPTRVWLLQAVAEIGGKSEMEYLARYLDDPFVTVRSTAAESMGYLAHVDFGFPKEGGPFSPDRSIERAREWWNTHKSEWIK